MEKIHAKKCKSIKGFPADCDCDGYHTFNELYDHRIALFICLLKQNISRAWRSRKHSDGTSFDGWFIAGLNKNKGEQITYHLPEDKWKELFMIETLEKAPEFDNHTSDDVLRRLFNFKNYYQSKNKPNLKKH
jgi:hypothetical protein